MISINFMKYYTSFMCNINTFVFYTLTQSVLIISVNEVWITCEIDQLLESHFKFHWYETITNIYVIDTIQKHIFKSHCYEILYAKVFA
jgi:hypothetical protein